MSDQEWFLQKLSELEIKEDKVEILNDIKSRLDTTTPFAITSNFLLQPQLFDCAYEKSDEQIQLTCDILALCLSTLDINRTDFERHLIKSLKHRNPKVRSLALDEIYKKLLKVNSEQTSSRGQNDQNQIELDQEIILLILKALDNDETAVAGPAIKILSIILQTKLDDQIIRNELKLRLEEKDVVKIRVYEVVVNLIKANSILLGKLRDFLDNMLSELDSNDILFQMNLLELLVSLAEQNHGFVFMEDEKVFDKIASRIRNVNADPLVQLLVPGFMKFFGKIAFYQPTKIMKGYPDMILYLLNSFREIDVNILPVALDTIGNLAHSSQGKIILDEDFPQEIKSIFEEYSSLLRNLPTDLKCRTLSSLQVVFTHEGNQNNRIELITKKWCGYLMNSDNDLAELLQFCQNPFPDIKVSCLTFIKTICFYQWGIEAIKNTAALIELLLNRKVEFDKNVKYAKYEIINILAESDKFDAPTLLQLKRYVAEGPYFVEPMMEVAVD